MPELIIMLLSRSGVAVSEDGLNWKRLSEEPFYEMENRENGIQVNLVILTFYRS